MNRIETLLCLALLFASLLAGSIGAQEVKEIPEKVRKRIKKAKSFVEKTRQLNFNHDVDVHLSGGSEYGKKLIDQLKRTFHLSLSDLDAYLKVLELIPDRLQVPGAVQAFYFFRVAAFYRDRKIYVTKGRNPSTSLLVHEFTHALDDDQFKYLRHAAENRGNYDRQMGLMAVIEGCAESVQARFDKRMPKSLAKHRENEITSWVQTDNRFPIVFDLTMSFSYRMGHMFVEHVLDRKGWDGVNQLFLRPPETTEQVMHPEKYFEFDRPVSFDAEPLDRALFENGHRRTYSTSFGELGMFLTLMAHAETPATAYRECLQAAAGWEGDRLLFFDQIDVKEKEKEKSPDRVFAIWTTYWETEKDAGEAAKQFRHVFSTATGNKPVDTGNVTTYPSDDGSKVYGFWKKGKRLYAFYNLPKKMSSDVTGTFSKIAVLRPEPVAGDRPDTKQKENAGENEEEPEPDKK